MLASRKWSDWSLANGRGAGGFHTSVAFAGDCPESGASVHVEIVPRAASAVGGSGPDGGRERRPRPSKRRTGPRWGAWLRHVARALRRCALDARVSGTGRPRTARRRLTASVALRLPPVARGAAATLGVRGRGAGHQTGTARPGRRRLRRPAQIGAAHAPLLASVDEAVRPSAWSQRSPGDEP